MSESRTELPIPGKAEMGRDAKVGTDYAIVVHRVVSTDEHSVDVSVN